MRGLMKRLHVNKRIQLVWFFFRWMFVCLLFPSFICFCIYFSFESSSSRRITVVPHHIVLYVQHSSSVVLYCPYLIVLHCCLMTYNWVHLKAASSVVPIDVCRLCQLIQMYNNRWWSWWWIIRDTAACRDDFSVREWIKCSNGVQSTSAIDTIPNIRHQTLSMINLEKWSSAGVAAAAWLTTRCNCSWWAKLRWLG